MSDNLFAKAEKEFFDRYFAMNPLVASYWGLHEPYDRLVPDGSHAAVQEGVVLLRDYLETVNALDDQTLSTSRAIDKGVVRHAYDQARFSMEEQKGGRQNPEGLGEFLSVCFLAMVREYAPLKVRLESLAARLWELPSYLDQFRGRFSDERVAAPLCEAALVTAQAAPEFLRELCVVAGRGDAGVARRFERSCNKAIDALATHIEWLRAMQGRSMGSGALGRDRFDDLVSIRKIGMDVPEILALGLDHLDRGKIRLAESTRQRQAGLGKSEPRIRLPDGTPKDFDDVLNMVRVRVAEARQFVIDEDLAGVPDGDGVDVVETPAFLRAFVPFAAIFPPGKFETLRRGVCMITRPPKGALAARFQEGEVTNLVAHETYPGHFLQAYVTGFGSKTRWLIQAPETVEGWAHYAEQLMLDRGFHDTAAARYAQTRASVWRAARVIMDVCVSCGEWSAEQAAAFMMSEASLDKDSALAEVRRAYLQPGRLLSYLVGKHLITRLRNDARSSLGERFSEKRFHDTICANGYLPHHLLRRAMDDCHAGLQT